MSLISWMQSPSAVILEPKKIKSVTFSTFPTSVHHEMMGPDTVMVTFFNVRFSDSFFTFLFHPRQEAL